MNVVQMDMYGYVCSLQAWANGKLEAIFPAYCLILMSFRKSTSPLHTVIYEVSPLHTVIYKVSPLHTVCHLQSQPTPYCLSFMKSAHSMHCHLGSQTAHSILSFTKSSNVTIVTLPAAILLLTLGRNVGGWQEVWSAMVDFLNDYAVSRKMASCLPSAHTYRLHTYRTCMYTPSLYLEY